MTQQGLTRTLRAYFSARLDGCEHLPSLLARLESTTLHSSVPPHACGCVECRALIEDWPRSSMLFEVPEHHVTPPSARWRPRLTAIAALAAASALAVMLSLSDPPPDSSLIAKGGWSLQVGVQRGDHAFRAQPGQPLRTGDRLGFFYSADRAGHLRIIYLDAERAWLQLYPRPGREDAVSAGHEHRVEGGAVLTNGAGCEAVIGVFTPRPLSASRLRETIDRLGRAPDGCPVSSSPEVFVFEVRR